MNAAQNCWTFSKSFQNLQPNQIPHRIWHSNWNSFLKALMTHSDWKFSAHFNPLFWIGCPATTQNTTHSVSPPLTRKVNDYFNQMIRELETHLKTIRTEHKFLKIITKWKWQFVFLIDEEESQGTIQYSLYNVFHFLPNAVRELDQP